MQSKQGSSAGRFVKEINGGNKLAGVQYALWWVDIVPLTSIH